MTSPTFDLRLGDCLDPVTGMASLADGSVDHVICDPPFESEAHTLMRRVKRYDRGRAARIDGMVAVLEPLPFDPIDEATRVAAAEQMARLARRWILVFCQVEASHLWRASLERAGAKYKRTCIWYKPDGQPQMSGDRPGVGYESIVTAHGKGRSRWNGGGRTGVFIEPKQQPRDSHDGVEHPTRKPVPLMETLVSLFTDPGDLVLDPFAGSGTTGVACIRNGRRFVGWEKDPKYHAIAVKRLAATREQLALDLGGSAA